MSHEWKRGDRAKCIDDHEAATLTAGTVYKVEDAYPAGHYMGDFLVTEHDHEPWLKQRFKPVVRVAAQTRPTPPTPDELTDAYWVRRLAYGRSRYQTGADVFKVWDVGKGPVPKYEELGN